MPESRRVRVSVVYAEPGRVFDVALALPEGASVADAIEASGFARARPDVPVRTDRLGVFAHKVAPTTRLRDGDRVEIYRLLRIDPKEARRRRARRGSRQP